MKSRSRRSVPAALVAALVLAACGSDDPAGIGNVDTVPGVSHGALLAPQPIRVADAGGSSGVVASVSESDPARSDMSIMPVSVTDFVVGGGMPALPTGDVGYVFQAGATVTAEQVAALAATFGVVGDPVRLDDGYGVSWRVGPEDGTAAAVTVYEDAQLSWNYNSAWADQSGAVSCGVAEPIQVDPARGDDVAVLDTVVVDPDANGCETPAPPTGVPNKQEAEQRARDLLAAAGGNPAEYRLEAYADEWFASVSAVQRLDGAFDGRRWDFGFGADAVLQYAGGQLAEPARVGPYPLVDLDTAITRLKDQSGFWGGYAGGGIAVAEPAIGADEAPSDIAVDVPEGDVTAIVPTDPMTEPEPVVVTLVDVQADLWWAWDVDGSLWLLPAYRFIGEDGAWYTVPAVTDEFLVQVDPPVVIDGPPPPPEPLPVETVPGEPPPEPAPVDPAVVEIVDVVRDVQYYPGCSNEPVTVGDTTWYPLAEFEFGDVVAEIVAIPRQDPTDAVSGFARRVAPPGPGDDVGTLVVYADGIARYESVSGTVIWLTLDEQTYDWVC